MMKGNQKEAQLWPALTYSGVYVEVCSAQEVCAASGWRCCRLDGSTDVQQRQVGRRSCVDSRFCRGREGRGFNVYNGISYAMYEALSS